MITTPIESPPVLTVFHGPSHCLMRATSGHTGRNRKACASSLGRCWP